MNTPIEIKPTFTPWFIQMFEVNLRIAQVETSDDKVLLTIIRHYRDTLIAQAEPTWYDMFVTLDDYMRHQCQDSWQQGFNHAFFNEQ